MERLARSVGTPEGLIMAGESGGVRGQVESRAGTERGKEWVKGKQKDKEGNFQNFEAFFQKG